MITTLFRFESSRCFKRAALLFVFAVGVLSIVATAVRMAVILGNLDSFGLLPWGLMRTAMVLSHVEVFAAILAITLPSVGKVVAVAVGAVRGRIGSRSSAGGNGDANFGSGSGAIHGSPPRRPVHLSEVELVSRIHKDGDVLVRRTEVTSLGGGNSR